MRPTKQLPKEGRKKGWHLPFPWLWNPTGSKLFEVLLREETVIASILKRGGKCHYTRITVAVTSAQKANELAASRRSSRRARNRNKRLMCQRCVARVGCSVPRDTKKRQGVQFLNTVSFNSSLTAPSASFPRFCIFYIPLISCAAKEEAESTQASCCKINEGVKLLSWITPKECNDSMSKMLPRRTVSSLSDGGRWLQH